MFLIVGIGLLALEAFVASGGILGSGGAVSVVLALSIFVGNGSTDLDLRRLLLTAGLVLLAAVALSVFALALILRGNLSGTAPPGGARL